MGCAQGPISVTKFQHFTTPAELQTCKVEPAVPQTFTQDSQLGYYILDMRDAGQDCRDKMARRNQVEQAVP
jgi:hypothetical protein